MNLDLFSAQLLAMQDRMAELRENASVATEEKGNVLEETFEAFNVSLEELRVAEEELTAQNEQLLLSRQEVEAERQRYRDLFNFAPDGYLVTDKLGMIQEANRAASELLGVDQNFLAGKPLANFVPEPDRQEFRAVLNSLGTGDEPRQWEGKLIPRHGTPFSAALAVSKVLGLSGEPVGLRWMVRDITAGKRTEEQLRDVYDKHEQRVQQKTARLEGEVQWKEQLLANERAARADAETARRGERDLLDSMPALIYEADAETGRYLLVSEYGATLFGYPTSAWLATPHFGTEIIHPDDREMVVAQRKKWLTAGTKFELEYRVLKADGQTSWVRDLVRIEADADGRPRRLRGIITNIQRRKRVERRLHFKKHEVEAQFLDMSHMYDLCLRLATSLNLPDVLAEVLKAATALQGAEMGVVWLRDRDSDELTPVCSQGFPDGFTERMGRGKIGEGCGGIAVAECRRVVVEDVESDPRFAPSVALAHEFGFRAVFSTPLFSQENAVFGTLTTYFREPHRPCDRQARLVELYAHLAGRFIENARLHQAALDAARKNEEWLATIRQEVRRLSASLTNARGNEAREVLERQVRHMSRIIEDLTSVTGEGEVAGLDGAPAAPALRRALVVDDDADSARNMARLLRIWGYDVRTAHSGPEALAVAHNSHPEVVLLDIGLPGLDGYEVAKALRRDLPGPLLIFAVTGYSHPDDLRTAESSGFDHYLVKPIDLDFLQTCLSRAEHARAD